MQLNDNEWAVVFLREKKWFGIKMVQHILLKYTSEQTKHNINRIVRVECNAGA